MCPENTTFVTPETLPKWSADGVVGPRPRTRIPDPSDSAGLRSVRSEDRGFETLEVQLGVQKGLMIMPDDAERGVRVFISYAHEDEDLKNELEKHLKVLKRSSKVNVWSDRQLVAGQEWDESIMAELNTAHVILLLISVDFNASDFIWDKELTVAMERHKAGTARVVPVILRKCDWDKLPYAVLQALPRNATPVTEYPDRDVAYTEIAQGVEQLVDQMNEHLGVGA